jgi:hypothetical protein
MRRPRGGGTITREDGLGHGAFVAPILSNADGLQAIRAAAPSLLASDRITATRVLEVDQGGTRIATKEKSIRSDDRSFDVLFLVEALDDAALTAAVAKLGGVAPGLATDVLHFEQIFSLDEADLAKEI